MISLRPRHRKWRNVAATAVVLSSLGTACGSRPLRVRGSSDTCLPIASDAVGAASGRFDISGHAVDANGAPVVGARITLRGSASAQRSTDLTGGYHFRVDAGSFQLAASESCALVASSSSNVAVTNASATRDFAAATTDGCVVALVTSKAPGGARFNVMAAGVVLGSTAVVVTEQPDASAAVARLADIASEVNTPSCSVTIAGSPAIERQALVKTSGPGASGAGGDGSSESLAITTAIAVGATVVRFESQTAPDAAQAVVDRFLGIGRAFTPDELSDLQ
jgi:hypothetical protein